jgi:hypothetical protein
MPSDVPPPSTVLLLVFAAWTAGTAVFAALTRAGDEVQPGHFKVMWLVTAALAGVAGIGYAPMWVVAALGLITFFAIYRKRDREAGFVTATAAVAGLIGAALQQSDAWTLAFVAAAGWLVGAVTNAMLLGHWHLNQPRLSTGPLRRIVLGLWAGVAVFAVACALLLVAGLRSPAGIAALGATTALAFTVFAGVLTAMVTHLVKTRSIMSATGILYLEILLCFVAVFTGTLGALG